MRKKKTLAVLATVAAVGVTAVAAPAPAEARGRGIGPGLAFGLAAGAITAGAVAASPPYGYGYGYGPRYGYYGGPGYYRPGPVRLLRRRTVLPAPSPLAPLVATAQAKSPERCSGFFMRFDRDDLMSYGQSEGRFDLAGVLRASTRNIRRVRA